MMTLEQIQALVAGPDISEQERQRGFQFNAGDRMLNAMGRIKGNDRGSNIGRAGFGISSALGNYKGMKASPDITRAKQDMFSKLLRAFQKGNQPAGSEEDEFAVADY